MKIEGLGHCVEMRSLYVERRCSTCKTFALALIEVSCSWLRYMQENCITKMENLETMVLLDTLNLDQNMIRKIEGLATLKQLNTLMLKVSQRTQSRPLSFLLSLLSLSEKQAQKY